MKQGGVALTECDFNGCDELQLCCWTHGTHILSSSMGKCIFCEQHSNVLGFSQCQVGQNGGPFEFMFDNETNAVMHKSDRKCIEVKETEVEFNICNSGATQKWYHDPSTSSADTDSPTTTTTTTITTTAAELSFPIFILNK